MDIRRIDPNDEAAVAAWCEVLRRFDTEHWGDIPGLDERFVKALATGAPGVVAFDMLAAHDGDRQVMGIAGMEMPQRDNLASVECMIHVLPEHRRQGIGTCLGAEVEQRAADLGRSVLNCRFVVPIAMEGAHPSGPFARRLGFEALQHGDHRILRMPVDPPHLASLRHEVAQHADGYRIFSFRAPWPAEYLKDQCELERRMSTDMPSNDEMQEEQQWDAARVAEVDAMIAAQGFEKLITAAQHEATGRIVAFTQLAVSEARPLDAWQWATLVLGEHRGHRLGLAVKLANLDHLARAFPGVRRVITDNARDNVPMIAVNDLIGFTTAGTGTIWQKVLAA